MRYRTLGKTGLSVSEIGLGGEWLERHNAEEVYAVVRRAADAGINILDCWMAEPNVRTNLGRAIHEDREKWIVQGHIGSTWQGGQYVRTRDAVKCREAFEDLLTRMQTDYMDIGMIHNLDSVSEWESIQHSEYLDYVMELKRKGVIRHIGLSTHNPEIAFRAVRSGYVEMLLFSANPAFDMMPSNEDLMYVLTGDFHEGMDGIAPERAEVYRLCEELGIGITVMKSFCGGRLLKAETSPFGAALTPVQCIHYSLTRPSACSVLVGAETEAHIDEAVSYETATEKEKDYASALAKAPHHAYAGQCTYCGHCAPCVKKLDVAAISKYYDLAVMQSEVPPTVREHYLSLEHRAGECIGCRACEARCPFGVKIAERMRLARELFGE